MQESNENNNKDSNSNNISLPLKSFLHFIWSFDDGSLRPFKIVNSAIASLIQQQDKEEKFCHCEVITNDRIKVWQIHEWETEYSNVIAKKFENEVQRRLNNAMGERIALIKKAIARKLNVNDEAIIAPLAIELAKNSNDKIAPMLGITTDIDLSKLDDIKTREQIEDDLRQEIEQGKVPSILKV